MIYSTLLTYSNGVGTAGQTPWASNGDLIITEGWGGEDVTYFSFFPSFSPDSYPCSFK